MLTDCYLQKSNSDRELCQEIFEDILFIGDVCVRMRDRTIAVTIKIASRVLAKIIHGSLFRKLRRCWSDLSGISNSIDIS